MKHIINTILEEMKVLQENSIEMNYKEEER